MLIRMKRNVGSLELHKELQNVFCAHKPVRTSGVLD